MEALLDDPLWDACLEESVWALRLDSPPSLLDLNPDHLSPDLAIDYLVELQREQSRLAALEARALVVAAGRWESKREVLVLEPDTEVERSLVLADEIRDEIAAALHRSAGVVHDQIVVARLLSGALAGTSRALASGRISLAHARAIAEQARRIDGADLVIHDDPADDRTKDSERRRAFLDACEALESAVLAKAEASTPAQTRHAARAAVHAIDAQGQDRRRQQARQLIDVRIYPEDDGLAVLLARLPVEQAMRVHAALDARARTTRTECSATLGELRVKALVDAMCGGFGCGREAHDAACVTAEIGVVIDLASLLGLVEAPATITGSLGGPTTVTAQAIREMLADPSVPANLRRLVSDPLTGALLDRGRTRYAVTGALRAFLVARDQTCRHPGCTRPAARCEVDHAREWADGGRSDRDNTGHLCVRHHQLKTHGGWEVTDSGPDGTRVWRSPLGRTYTVEPPTLVPRRHGPAAGHEPEPQPPPRHLAGQFVPDPVEPAPF